MKNTAEACIELGIDRNRFKRLRIKHNIETVRGMREGNNSTMTFISDENIEVMRKIINVDKPKKEEKKVKKDKKRLEFFRVRTSNIYRVYEVKGENTKLLGTCTQKEYDEFKKRLKGVK